MVHGLACSCIELSMHAGSWMHVRDGRGVAKNNVDVVSCLMNVEVNFK